MRAEDVPIAPWGRRGDHRATVFGRSAAVEPRVPGPSGVLDGPRAPVLAPRRRAAGRSARRGDGIYFVNGDTVSIVSVGPGPRPALGLPRPLFTSVQSEDLALSANRMAGFPLDEHPDGARFIGVRRTESPAVRTLTFVENWLTEFRRRQRPCRAGNAQGLL